MTTTRGMSLPVHLDGRGVRSIDDALGQWRMAEVLEPFRRLLSVAMLERLASDDDREEAVAELLEVARTEVATLLDAALSAAGSDAEASTAQVEGRILTELEAVLELAQHIRSLEKGRAEQESWVVELRRGPR